MLTTRRHPFRWLLPSTQARAFVTLSLTAISMMAGLGLFLAWAQFVAAALDAAENLALIQVLLGSSHPAWPLLAWTCAGKFLIVLAGLGYTLIGAALIHLPARPERLAP